MFLDCKPLVSPRFDDAKLGIYIVICETVNGYFVVCGAIFCNIIYSGAIVVGKVVVVVVVTLKIEYGSAIVVV